MTTTFNYHTNSEFPGQSYRINLTKITLARALYISSCPALLRGVASTFSVKVTESMSDAVTQLRSARASVLQKDTTCGTSVQSPHT